MDFRSADNAELCYFLYTHSALYVSLGPHQQAGGWLLFLLAGWGVPINLSHTERTRFKQGDICMEKHTLLLCSLL